MYDAKTEEKEDVKDIKYFESIGDRGYFYNPVPYSLGRTKLSYVPKENLFE
ncbi:hypothetical protein [Clostridium sp.]|uniref:hypothetical protein n=1 Tax=Clostridium sp. TaxID=1506 RepID=UPI0034644F69